MLCLTVPAGTLHTRDHFSNGRAVGADSGVEFDQESSGEFAESGAVPCPPWDERVTCITGGLSDSK